MNKVNLFDFCKSISIEVYNTYTVDDLLNYVKGKPTINVDLKELAWQYPHDRISKKRITNVVIDGWPIIVYRDKDGTLKTLDGFHRAYKAIKEGRSQIKAYLITDRDIAILNSRAAN